ALALPMLESQHRLKLRQWVSRRRRHALRRVRSRKRKLLFETGEVEGGGSSRERLVRTVMDVHQAKIEIFAIISAMSWFVIVLEPVGADDVPGFEEGLKRVAESGGTFLLRGNDGVNTAIVFVAASIVSSAHVELADENRLSSQSMECLQIEPCEA